MPDIQTKYGTQGQAITITLASLSSTAAKQSVAIDNSTNKFLDSLVFLVVRTGVSGTSATGFVNIFGYGTVNNGTDYSDTVTGVDSVITLTSPPNLRLIGAINAVANNTNYKGGPFSVASAFGGVLPTRWGIVVENRTGAALASTEADFKSIYQGVKGESI